MQTCFRARVSFRGGKGVRQVDYSPSSTAEAANTLSYPSSPPYAFMSCTGTLSVLIMHNTRCVTVPDHVH